MLHVSSMPQMHNAELWYSSTYSQPQHQTKVSKHLHVPANTPREWASSTHWIWGWM